MMCQLQVDGACGRWTYFQVGCSMVFMLELGA